MRISKNGIDLIKKYEGCRLTAYKPISSEKYYTIGYGHYGSDVYYGMKITYQTAESLLIQDLERFENAVNVSIEFELNQNQFDALVSFAYNCGTGAVTKLIKNKNAQQIGDSLLKYVYGANGKILHGLVRRRNEEYRLFTKECEGLTVTQYKELKNILNELKPQYYDWTTACPEWSIPYVQKALDMGYIKGDELGRLRLTDDRIWTLVVSMRINGIMK